MLNWPIAIRITEASPSAPSARSQATKHSKCANNAVTRYCCQSVLASKRRCRCKNFLITGDVFLWGPIMVGAVLSSLPVILLYFMAQRFMVTGMTAGSVKG